MAASPSPTRCHNEAYCFPRADPGCTRGLGEIDFALRPAHAWLAQKAATVATSQVLSANATGTLANTAARYHGARLFGRACDFRHAVHDCSRSPGSITKLRMNMLTAPTSTATWTVELKKNGSNTGLTCTITSASSGKCSTTGSVSYAAGDYASLVSHPGQHPDSHGRVDLGRFRADHGERHDNDRPGRQLLDQLDLCRPAVQRSVAEHRSAAAPSPMCRTAALSIKLYVISTAPGSTGQTIEESTIGRSARARRRRPSCARSRPTRRPATTPRTRSASPALPAATAGDYVTFPAAPSGTPTSVTAVFGARYRPTTTGSFPLMVGLPERRQHGERDVLPAVGRHQRRAPRPRPTPRASPTA